MSDNRENLGWGTGRTHIIREKDWCQLNQWNGYHTSTKSWNDLGKVLLWVGGISLLVLGFAA